MIRGTTPTITYYLPFDTSTISKLWLTFSQNKNELFTLCKDDCTFYESSIEVELTQEETLRLDNLQPLAMQFRILTVDEKAIASNIMYTDVGAILRDGEIE